MCLFQTSIDWLNSVWPPQQSFQFDHGVRKYPQTGFVDCAGHDYPSYFYLKKMFLIKWWIGLNLIFRQLMHGVFVPQCLFGLQLGVCAACFRAQRKWIGFPHQFTLPSKRTYQRLHSVRVYVSVSACLRQTKYSSMWASNQNI